jgi:hypothetical protein
MLVAASIVAVNVVGVVAYAMSMVNWHSVVCKARGSHSLDWYTHDCKCGYTRRKH